MNLCGSFFGFLSKESLLNLSFSDDGLDSFFGLLGVGNNVVELFLANSSDVIELSLVFFEVSKSNYGSSLLVD